MTNGSQYAHLVSLRARQILRDGVGSRASLPDLHVAEGFPLDDSNFAPGHAFWPGWIEADFADQTQDDIGDRYTEDEFVADHADTNPGEDVTETFAPAILLSATSLASSRPDLTAFRPEFVRNLEMSDSR